MSLTVNRDTIRGKRPVFAKVLEYFTGGFGWEAWATDLDPIDVPAGTLLTIDEETRTCRYVKRGRLAAASGSGATQHVLEHGSMFQAGDFVRIAGAGTGTRIIEVRERADDTLVRVGALSAAASAAAGAILNNGSANLGGTANAIAALPTRAEAGASVTVLRRGTVYTNRIQPLTARDEIPTGGAILFSTSS